MPADKTVIINKKAYTFKELLELEGTDEISSKAVDKARQWLADAATDDEFWYEYVIDEWKEALEQIGFTKPDINFSGFWSQGDGASFTSGVNVEEVLKFITSTFVVPDHDIVDVIPGTDKNDYRPWIYYKIKEKSPYSGKNTRRFRRLIPLAEECLSGTVTRTNHHYSHEMTCRLELSTHGDLNYRSFLRVEKLVNELEETLEELRRDLCHAIYISLRDEYEYRVADEQLIEASEANEYTFDREGNRW